MAHIPRTMFFADGENLVFRYQTMVAEGHVPKEEVVHITDEFVWASEVTTFSCLDIMRVTFYTSAVGDEGKLHALKSTISGTDYEFAYSPDDQVPHAIGLLVPSVFKKARKSHKSRSVDIQMTIDLLRHAMRRDCEQIVILTGDGDFIPIVRECMSLGVEVHVCGFSSGLHPELRISADGFSTLDEYFFEKGASNQSL